VPGIFDDVISAASFSIPVFSTSLTCVNFRQPCPCDARFMSEKPLIDVMQEKILSLAEETKFAANGIVSRTLLRTANARVVLFGFAEGQELTEHTSTQCAVIQILSGECELSLAGKPHVARTGDMIYMPPHLPHAVKATRQFSMLLTLSLPAAS
jgi:quercetin dioxygenase-like cupin family protein